MASYRGPCGADAVSATAEPAATVTVTLKNRGRCPVTIELKDNGVVVAGGRTVVDPGDQKTLSKAGVARVAISCGADPEADGADETPRCRFTYTIDME